MQKLFGMQVFYISFTKVQNLNEHMFILIIFNYNT